MEMIHLYKSLRLNCPWVPLPFRDSESIGDHLYKVSAKPELGVPFNDETVEK